MNPGNFCRKMEGVITGTGFKRSIPGLDLTALRDADGTILTASTEPDVAALETHFVGLQSNTSQTDLGTLVFMVPRDYDATVDKIRIRFLACSAGDTDTPTIDASIYRKRAGADLSDDLDPTISDEVNNSTTGAGWVEIKVEGEDLEPGDVLTCVFAASAHTTDILYIYALEVVYMGDLAYYEDDERNDWQD